MGGFELGASASGEPTVRYHPSFVCVLTYHRHPVEGHYQAGSLTGAVASQSVTEAREGSLRLFGNQPTSVKAEESLTVRLTSRTGGKPGAECNGTRGLDCETDGSSRYESRS